MTTLRSALRAGRISWLLRGLLWTVAFSLAWLQVSPAYAAAQAAVRENARRAAWLRAHTPRVNLPIGLTQTPDAALRAKIDAKQAAEAVKPVADVRPLSPRQMQRAWGRGAYRNPYFNGILPWQRSFRDVNLCTGNLFKSFTDVQVAPGRGAGLVLQRTYNSNDARVGPFGVGWTHAYDIRMQEAPDVKAQSGNASSSVDGATDDIPRTDFLGAKHTYHRDADGLYSPPSYMFDETSSDYDSVLVNGPTKVMADTEKGEDGTIKHYVNVVTLADGTEGNERACDYIQDRHGNTTNLAYGLSYAQPDGSTRKLLTQVTDPSGRSLVFTWTNLSTTAQPAYRITQVQGPIVSGASVPGVTYRIVYAYYTDPNEANAANDLYNLQSVTLDPDGLNRTTMFNYTGVSGSSGVDNGLLASITGPLGHVISYSYTLQYNTTVSLSSGNINMNGPTRTGTVWVYQVTEPAGIDNAGNPRTMTWEFSCPAYQRGTSVTNLAGIVVTTEADDRLRFIEVDNNKSNGDSNYIGTDDVMFSLSYDNENNVIEHDVYSQGPQDGYAPSQTAGGGHDTRSDLYAYGAHGNPLVHTIANQSQMGQDTTTWYNASQYFQKASGTDMNGHTTAMGIGTSTDANTGNRGETLWVQDAGYSDATSPSYHKQSTYTYNQYGQKTSETNLNGIVTACAYGDQWGNLTQVVQDPGTGHLNRTTTMSYDVAGRVLQSTDPSGQTSTFTYNILGQPLTVATPAKGATPAETISYSYDGNGRTHAVTDNRGQTTLAYDAGCDRVRSVTDPVTGSITYTYTPTGERLTMSLPGGGQWKYTYSDPFNVTYLLPKDDPNSFSLRLEKITDDQGRQAIYNFSGDGILYSSTSNQTFNQAGSLVAFCRTGYVHDLISSQDRVLMTQTLYQSQGSNGGSQQHLLSQNNYTYDNTGQRLTNTITDQNGAIRVEKYQKPDGTSGYDALNRLTNVNYGDGQTQSYTFDAMGNRLSRQDSASGTTNYSYNAANMLLSTGGYGASGFQNDADGNTLVGNGRTNAWDSQNRLVSCLFGGNTTAYRYGADGLRRQSTKNGVSTDYANDGTMLVREGHATGGTLTPSTVTATYFQGPSGPCYRRDDTQTELDSQGRTVTKARWYVYDGLGSVVGEVDPLGNLTSSPKYDVYGAVRSNAGTASSKQEFVGSLGHVSDDTGLIYMRARYMDPVLGRFMSEDGSKNGSNWFAYCDSNPITRHDATGNSWELDILKTVIDIWKAYVQSGGNPFKDIKKLREARQLALHLAKIEGEEAGADTAIADREKVIGDETGAALAGGNAGRSATDAARDVSVAETARVIEQTIEGESDGGQLTLPFD